MIRDITFGQYYRGDSVFYRMDPRMKIILTIVFAGTLFACKSAVSLGFMMVCLAVIIAISGVPPKMLIRNVRPLLFIMIFTAVLNLFYIDGRVLWQAWVFKITVEGIQTAIFIVIRIALLVISSSLLTYTTTPTDLTDAIERLLGFLKVIKIDVHSIAMMMTIALRFIPTLIDEVDKIMNAQKARGADMDSGGMIKKAKALIPVLIPLFVSAFRRAFDLAYAMECRCYQGGKNRTKMKQVHYGLRDLTAFLIVLAIIAAVILLNRVRIGGF